ncbi:MAG: hypothetical protein ACYTGN_11605 [Planctomycetota bacterium]|jgi:hypothetical protein
MARKKKRKKTVAETLTEFGVDEGDLNETRTDHGLAVTRTESEASPDQGIVADTDKLIEIVEREDAPRPEIVLREDGAETQPEDVTQTEFGALAGEVVVPENAEAETATDHVARPNSLEGVETATDYVASPDDLVRNAGEAKAPEAPDTTDTTDDEVLIDLPVETEAPLHTPAIEPLPEPEPEPTPEPEPEPAPEPKPVTEPTIQQPFAEPEEESGEAEEAPAPEPTEEPPRGFRPYILIATTAIGAEIAACILGLGFSSPLMLALAGCLHVGAALLGLRASLSRRKELSQTEKDIVLVVGLFVPVFGPCMAWAMPHAISPDKVENAHEVFEAYAEHVKPAAPDYERTVFTGDYTKDLARELDAESYHEVLRHGSTDQKRNALRRLADLGQPMHFRLIRSCLLDPEHEVRLYAYSDLERASRGFEESIAKLSKAAEAGSADAASLLKLARAYYNYAASGILDKAMAAFYFRSAERFATQAGGHDGVRLQAGSLSQLDEFEAAEAALASLPDNEQRHADSCLVRADMAYRRRDFRAAREEAEQLRAAGAEPPPWLAALEEVVE